MYTQQAIEQLLQRLLAIPAETEIVEFKQAKNTFSDNELGEYFSALSNEANLKGQSYGWLVFGVDNQTHGLVNTQYKISRPALDEMKKKIGDLTTNRITFEEIYAFEYNGKRVVMFQIPAAPAGIPVAYKGHYYGRDGESLGALNIVEIEQIRAQKTDTTFEIQAARTSLQKEEVLALLDYQRFYQLIDKDVPKSVDTIIDALIDYGFVYVTENSFSISNMGALLLARNLETFPTLRGREVIVRKYDGNNNRKMNFEQIGIKGYAVGFNGLVDFIMKHTSTEYIGTMREDVPQYPKVAIREFVANALVHQDFSISGMPLAIEIFDNRLTITNPGISLNDIERLIDLPPHSRNEKLAQAMFLFRLCERRGSGVDRAVEAIENMQLPAYHGESWKNFTRITLFPRKSFEQMSKEERIAACYQHVCLLFEDHIPANNQSIRERFGLDKNKAAIASHIIADTINAGLIKVSHPESTSRKFTTYIPFYYDL